MPDREPNYLKAAFEWQYNIIALGGAVAASLIGMNPAPLIVAAGLELMYLATVPNLPRFQRLVRARQFEKEKTEHDASLMKILYALPLERRSKFDHLASVRQAIRQNLGRLSSTSKIFTDQLEGRIDSLLAAFIRLSNHDVLHQQYLQTTNPDTIRREIGALLARMPKETPRVQEVNQRRLEILQKRLEKYAKIAENRQVIDAQSRSIEDVLQLIREQSMTMSNPQELSDRLDTLVRDVESTEDAVRELEGVFQLSPEIEGFNESSPSAGNSQRLPQ